MLILGIETSCDDTCVAVVDDKRNILSNCRYSQIQEHERFGGVVPEIAARSHMDFLTLMFRRAIEDSKIAVSDIDIIAVTAGPGLIGGLITGLVFAKTISTCLDKCFYGINHLEGHLLTPRLTNNIKYPYLALLASGGHLQIVWVENVAKYNVISSTIDDSAGESFDKVAKMLGLGYPGGPHIEKLAAHGNEKYFPMPMPMCNQNQINFSFSGLKTFVKNIILSSDIDEQKANICASFQYTVYKIFEYKILQAISALGNNKVERFVLVGGVASNGYIRNKIESFLHSMNIECILPDAHLCTDNAAMISWAAYERYSKRFKANKISMEPVSRWPLDVEAPFV